jgi:hypothetical protein
VQFVQCFKAGSLYSFSIQECIFSFFFPDVHKRSGRWIGDGWRKFSFFTIGELCVFPR